MMRNSIFLLLFLPFWGLSQEWNQLGTDILGEANGDRFGQSTALSEDGTIMAVGAQYNDAGGNNAGHVRVFQFNGESWAQIGQDIDGEVSGDYLGLSIDLSDDGSILAVGGHLKAPGYAKIFQYNGTEWVQLGETLRGNLNTNQWGITLGQYFGFSLELNADGTRVAIGDYGEQGPLGGGQGVVRIYDYINGGWVQIGQSIEGQVAQDGTGTSVSLSDDGTIVSIASYANRDGGNNAGNVRVFQYNEGVWSQLGQSINGSAGDYLGIRTRSVVLSDDGTTLAVGSERGYVKVYKFIEGSWVQLGDTFTSLSGYAVSLSFDGTVLAVENKGAGAGRVDVYLYNGQSWVKQGESILGTENGEESGSGLSLNADGSIAAIGSRYYNGDYSVPGRVRVFQNCELSTLSPPVVETPSAICAGNTVTITAVANGATINWYDSLDAETPVFTGAEFTTLELDETTTYWVEAISLTGCISERAEVTVTVTLPVLTIETTDPEICSGTEAELFATSEGNVIFWYANEGDEEYLYHGNLFITEELTETTTYWVEAYSISTGCASGRIEVTVTVIPTPDAPTAVTVQTFTEGQTLADLIVEAEGDLTWYANETLTVVLPDTTPLVDNTTYYVTQTIGGCESEAIGILVQLELGISGVNGQDFIIYPNPTAGIVKIQSKVSVVNIEVFNINGQVVTSVKAVNEVNLSGYPGGIYVIKVALENGEVITKKVVKK